MADRIRPRMERNVRAKQFMPFDALKGFREALAKKEREDVPRKEFSPEQEEAIDAALRRIRPGDLVIVEYAADGAYARIRGRVLRIRRADRVLEMEGAKIPFDDISLLVLDE
ncbi:MAG: YolD-like family protein [Lachnospiraceae bacterium]|nr:YolD-like family protein [Lachnospiraceae bacterium]